jgi:hypothetical protein
MWTSLVLLRGLLAPMPSLHPQVPPLAGVDDPSYQKADLVVSLLLRVLNHMTFAGVAMGLEH